MALRLSAHTTFEARTAECGPGHDVRLQDGGRGGKKGGKCDAKLELYRNHMHS